MFFLYGPPGSGKSTIGRLLAEELVLDFCDLDSEVERRARMEIPAIFAAERESGFRKREKKVLQQALADGPGVVALGGGTLLDAQNRSIVLDAGPVLCLSASLETLVTRLSEEGIDRPLLKGNPERGMRDLLDERSEHYASFSMRLETESLSHAEAAREARILLGAFRVRGMGSGYDVRVQRGLLKAFSGTASLEAIESPIVLVTDENVGRHYAGDVMAALQEQGLEVDEFRIPAGEGQKTLRTVSSVWDAFTRSRVERKSVIIALGGGVVGDLTGFAAATFLRGVPWVNLPTSLLAMVDASLGGKTGVNLPQGKNLVGAFHAPQAVFSDTLTLGTLPELEIINGLAEVVKHGVIADPWLFNLCEEGAQALRQNLEEAVRRAVAVKIEVIEKDPYETGEREVLNLGHTVGHALEVVSQFSIRHGEAVAMGLVVEAHISERLGIAAVGLADRLSSVLLGLDLPTEMPDHLDRARVVDAMLQDKKRLGGALRFSLPVSIGEVKTGIEIEMEELLRLMA